MVDRATDVASASELLTPTWGFCDIGHSPDNRYGKESCRNATLLNALTVGIGYQ
ncbi:hypothetical protein PROFUN_04073 [Planoprotostelium fungivorum]|uniref:Uncharacterized protein n=1 Tax=Planoprotostelium fungivorum TaxID=1890364 RepID=A0A2P6NJH0_9EUKA|nr:hypothetical protein PROFUN_04073 [Planoprotostelium fungivorum]